MSQRFIVTGGAGFIGSNLVRGLNGRGHTDIVIVDHLDDPAKRRNLDRVQYREYFDKVDFRAMLREGRVPEVDGVFHLGACSSTTETDEAYLADNNFGYTRDLCEWSLKTGARFVYASSAATYGDGLQGYSDADEVIPTLRPLNPYGRSKQMFDLWALRTGAIANIAGIKYFNVYGPGEDHKGDMRSMINKAYDEVVRSGRITLFRSHRPECRDGEQDRDFVYVADAVAVTLFFYDHRDVSGLFNCGAGEARTWNDLAQAVFAAMRRTPDIVYRDMPPGIRDAYQYHTRAEIAKLRRAGYTAPFISIEEGVRRYVADYLAGNR